MSRFPFTLALSATAISACASDTGNYPSLAPRPAEQRGFDEPEPRPTPAAAPDPALDAEAAALEARLNTAAQAFATAAERAQGAVARARGQAAGSDPWIAAQTALGGLDVRRTELSEIAAELERLGVERAATLAPAYPALETLRTRARAELERSQALIAQLGAQVAPAA